MTWKKGAGHPFPGLAGSPLDTSRRLRHSLAISDRELTRTPVDSVVAGPTCLHFAPHHRDYG
jgi:hypothetical protein